jgi:hypothetical protein
LASLGRVDLGFVAYGSRPVVSDCGGWNTHPSTGQNVFTCPARLHEDGFRPRNAVKGRGLASRTLGNHFVDSVVSARGFMTNIDVLVAVYSADGSW